MEQHLLPVVFASAFASALALGCAVRPSETPLAEAPKPATEEPAPAASAPVDQGTMSPASATNAKAEGQPDGAAGAATTQAEPSPSASTPGAAPDPASYGFPKDTLILHIGDSFAGSLGVPLGKRFKAAGMRTVLEFQTASYVPTWASGKELPGYVDKYRPSLVIITLGANEVELTAPETRAGAVKRLVGKLGGRPCVWVIPPLWKPDTGIFNVIRANAAPCRILESDSIVHEVGRKPDHIHPSDAAREIWADAVLAWLARERAGTAERPWELRKAP